jgi:HEAT repeat protein
VISIPTELLEQIERGNVLLFIGERLVYDTSGRAMIDRLAEQLASRCDTDIAADRSFPEVAQVYEAEKGRQALIQFIRDQLEERADQAQPIHRLIAGLTDCTVLVTTALNRALERAFADLGRPLDVVIGNIDIAFENERRAQLYKLRGSLDRAESLIMTEDDQERFFDDQSSLSVVLQGYLARKTILFIGYDLDDPHFKRLYRKVTAPLDNYARRAYAFGEAPPPRVSLWCKQHGISVVQADSTVFLRILVDQLAARARPPAAVAPVSAEDVLLPEHPYKLLDYYEAEDTSIFFGRQLEIQGLSALIHAHRLSLLYGASGVGKTSLLLAGALPRLERTDPPYTAVYARALDDPAQVIRRAIRRQIPEANLPENGTLVDFLDHATQALGHTLVIVLDQFEEFFIRLSPQFRTAFITELGAIYEARDVPVKMLLSLREDWLAAINEIEWRIPEVFRNRMRVLPLTQEQARQAITAPVERLGITYDPDLIERLLADLAGSTSTDIMPPQLQLVCSALYSTLKPNERTITLAAYERMGGARGVLQQYLDAELSRLGRDDRALARGALEELVTSQGTKAVKTADELALTLDVEQATLTPVLELLVRARLLRAIERDDGNAAYELAHEYLIREIGLGTEAQSRKQAEELIQQEVENWHRFGTLLAADKLALINDARAVLRLNDAAQELLLRSALQVGDEMEYWLGRVSDSTRRASVLDEMAYSKSASVRQRVAGMLATQDVPESVEPLIELALNDSDRTVRSMARASLAKLSNQRHLIVARLKSQTEAGSRAGRRAALEALAELPLRGLSSELLPPSLRGQALATRARMRASQLAQQSTATPLRRALALMTALVLVLLALFYIVSINSYTVSLAFSKVPPNTIIINQGNPLIPLPGFSHPEIDTGIAETDLSDEDRNRIVDGNVWGFWMQRRSGNQRWIEDVVDALRPARRASVRWYLGQQTQARDELLAAITDTTTPVTPDRDKAREQAANQLAEVVTAYPALADTATVTALLSLVRNQDSGVDARAAAALGLRQVLFVNPQLATPDLAARLAATLETDDTSAAPSDKRVRSIQEAVQSVLSPMLQFNPRLAAPDLLGVLIQSLSRKSSGSAARATQFDLIRLMLRTSPDLATAELVSTLLAFFDGDRDARVGAMGILAQMAQLNPKLATPELATSLRALLQDPAARQAAAQALNQMIGVNPQLATPDLLGDIRSLMTVRDAQTQIAAANALAQIVKNDPSIIPPDLADILRPLLQSDNSEVKRAALSALFQMAVVVPALAIPEVLTMINPLLQDSNAGVRGDTIAALGAMARARPALATSELVESLSPFLLDSEGYVRSQASSTIQNLSQINISLAGPDVALALRENLRHQNAGIRIGVAQLLSNLIQANSGLATPDLVADALLILREQDQFIRPSAVELIGRAIQANPTLASSDLLADLRSLLHDRNQSIRPSAVELIGRAIQANPTLASSDILADLVPLLGRTEPGRSSTIDLLGQIARANSKAAPAVLDILRSALQDTDPQVRASAADALADVEVAGSPALQTLLPALGDSDINVRVTVVSALGQIGAAQADRVPVIVDALRPLLDDQVQANTVRTAARAALVRIGGAQPSQMPTIVATLRPLLEAPDQSTAAAIAASLLQLLDKQPTAATPDLVAALRAFIQDENIYVLYKARGQPEPPPTAIYADDAATSIALQLLIQDQTQNSDVRIAATYELVGQADVDQNMIVQTLRPMLRGSTRERFYAINMLYQLAQRSTPVLAFDLLEDMQAILRDQAQDGDVRASAAIELGWLAETTRGLATQERADLLRSMFTDDDPNVRAAAMYGLRHLLLANPTLATAELLTAVHQLLQDSDGDVRSAAAAAVIQIAASNLALSEAAAAALRTYTPNAPASAPAAPNRLGRLGASKLVLTDAEQIAIWQSLLNDKRENIQLYAAGRLSVLVSQVSEPSAPEQITILQTMLQHGEPDVRRYALEALNRRVAADAKLATPELAHMLQAELQPAGALRADVLPIIARLLAFNPQLATPELDSALRLFLIADQPSLQAGAVCLLSQIGIIRAVAPPEDITALRTLFGPATTAPVRATAVAALGQLARSHPSLAREILPDLLGASTSPDLAQQTAAVQALSQILIADPSIATTDLAESLRKLLQSSTTTATRASIVRALGLLGSNPSLADGLADELRPLLQSPDDDLRAAAALALSQFHDVAPTLAAEIAGDLHKLLQQALQVQTNQTTAPPKPNAPRISDIALTAANALVQFVIANPNHTTTVLSSLEQLRRTAKSDAHSFVVSTMGRLGVVDPQAGQQALNVLAPLLKEGDSETRADAATALGLIGAAQPMLVSQIISLLIDRLSDSESIVNSSASNALKVVLKAHIGETQPVADMLLKLIQSDTSAKGRVRYFAAGALLQAAEANRALASPAAAAFISLQNDQNPRVRFVAANGLAGLLAVDPAIFTPEVDETLAKLLLDKNADETVAFAVVDMLTKGLTNKQISLSQQSFAALTNLIGDKTQTTTMRVSALKALSSGVANNPKLATPELVSTLSRLAHEENKGFDMRSNALTLMASIIDDQPLIVTSEVVMTLQDHFKDASDKERQVVLVVFAKCLSANKALATPQLIDALRTLAKDQSEQLRNMALAALSYAYTAQALRDGADESLMQLLVVPMERQERPAAARALVLVALNDVDRSLSIQEHLKALAGDSEPIKRIWANQALELLRTADLAHSATITIVHPNSAIEKRLSDLQLSSFFGAHMSWVAQEALAWIKQQASTQSDPTLPPVKIPGPLLAPTAAPARPGL